MVAAEKICTRADLVTRLDLLRAADARIVLTNGVFDLMHIGHLRYLQEARDFGDALVVGINSDASTRSLKGPSRPFVPEAERAEMVAGLACVDLVTIFDELTAVELARVVRPQIYVKGGDYSVPAYTDHDQGSASDAAAKPLPEAAIILELGGRVELVPYLPGHSTTELISRIVECSQPRGE
jgi:D-glycero-beta-D-manno-heptose 1-phosphate adenylyltransferase